MTADELLAKARREKPCVRYTTNHKRNAIAAFDPAKNRWVCVAGLLLDGRWASMPVELEVDGKPAIPQEDWIGD